MKRRLITSYKPSRRLIERRGRPRRFHAWDSIIFITAFGIVLCTLILFADHIRSKVAFANTATMYIQEANLQKDDALAQKEQIASQNALLKEKLTDANLVTVDPKTEAIVLYYIHLYFGSASATATKVFTCESHLNPNAQNINVNASGDYHNSKDIGIAQLNNVAQRNRFAKYFPGIDFETGAHDIQMNLRVAKALYDDQGWSPWVCAHLLEVVK